MAKKDYHCILYDIGDKVKPKFGTLFPDDPALEIEDTELKYVGIFPTLFLKFKGKAKDITDLSNYFVPADETIEKYKDGLVYFQEEKVGIAKKQSSTKAGAKTHITFQRRFNPKVDTLTEEDLKPKVMPKGLFSGRPPIKKE